MYLPDNALPQRTTNPFVLSTMVHKIKPLCTSQPRQHPLLPRFIWRTRACRPPWASSHDHVVSLPALSDRSLIDGYGPLMTHLLMGKIDGEPMGILEFLSLETTPYQTWSNNSVNTGLRNSWLGSLPGIRKTSPKWYPPKSNRSERFIMACTSGWSLKEWTSAQPGHPKNSMFHHENTHDKNWFCPIPRRTQWNSSKI